MHAELLVLRLVHILGGIFWVGSGLFTSFYLVPSFAGNPAQMGPVMAGLQRRGLFTALPIVALLTIASGARLMWIMAGSSFSAYLSTNMGLTLAIGAVLATLGFLLALLVGRPAFQRVGALSGSLAAITDTTVRDRTTAQIGALRHRATVANMTATILQLLAAACMAVARYLV